VRKKKYSDIVAVLAGNIGPKLMEDNGYKKVLMYFLTAKRDSEKQGKLILDFWILYIGL
jgi:hypothetical protein